MKKTLRELSDRLLVVSIPDKFANIAALNQYRDLNGLCTGDTVCDYYTALIDCFKSGLSSIADDMRAIVQLGETCEIIKNNTSVLQESSIEFIAPLSVAMKHRLMKHREDASQALSEEAPTATYLLYSGNHHYATVARSFRESISQTCGVLMALNRFIQLVDCPTPDRSLLEILATELAFLPRPALVAGTKVCNHNRLLHSVIASLADTSIVSAPVDRWIHFDDEIEIPAMNSDILPSMGKWIDAIQKCVMNLEQHTVNIGVQHNDELILKMSQDMADRLVSVTLLIYAQRMMCTHFHNLVLTQFKVMGNYYESLVMDLKEHASDCEVILSKVDATIASLQS